MQRLNTANRYQARAPMWHGLVGDGPRRRRPGADDHTRRLFPFLGKIFADSAYGGPKLRKAIAMANCSIEVVKRNEGHKGFEVLPRS